MDGTVSLGNDGDVFVGGTPDGRHLDGALDFLRIAHGTLADAFLRDFTGRKPAGPRRVAGAIEKPD